MLTTVRVLKNRWCGRSGVASTLEFNSDTGRLLEAVDFKNEENEQNDI
jgi:hypothetical protein